MIAEFHGDAVMTAARQEVDTVRNLFRIDHHGRRSCRLRGRLLHARRDLDRRGNVGLHVGNRQVEDRKTALPLNDAGRELHAPEVLIGRVRGFGDDITEHGGIGPGLNLLYKVVAAERHLERRPLRGK